MVTIFGGQLDSYAVVLPMRLPSVKKLLVGSQRSCNGDQKHILNQREIDRQDEFALRSLSKKLPSSK